jgi:hypothetical protein
LNKNQARTTWTGLLWFFTCGFLHQTTPPRPLIHGLVPFLIRLQNRGKNQQSWLFHSGINDSAVYVTAVSMIPLYISQQCQWHHCASNFVKYVREWNKPLFFIRKSDLATHGHSSIIDTPVTPLWHAQGCHWQHCANMTPLWLWTSYSIGSGYLREYLSKNKHRQFVILYPFPQQIWGLTEDCFFVIDTAVHKIGQLAIFHSQFSSQIWSHIQNGFNLCIRG